MQLMGQWTALTVSYTGWSLEEIQRLTPRERKNWLEIAREYGLVVKK